jgi:hypothetical protein
LLAVFLISLKENNILGATATKRKEEKRREKNLIASTAL